MYFYELHEGDDDLFSDLLLAREDEMEPEDFFELVQSIRRRIQDSYEHDTLIEAIADELERDYDFIAVTDDRLTAAVNVSQGRGGELPRGPRRVDDADEDDDDDDDDDDDRRGRLQGRSSSTSTRAAANWPDAGRRRPT